MSVIFYFSASKKLTKMLEIENAKQSAAQPTNLCARVCWMRAKFWFEIVSGPIDAMADCTKSEKFLKRKTEKRERVTWDEKGGFHFCWLRVWWRQNFFFEDISLKAFYPHIFFTMFLSCFVLDEFVCDSFIWSIQRCVYQWVYLMCAAAHKRCTPHTISMSSSSRNYVEIKSKRAFI